ncbi:hypothetical protein M501DRAFT_1017020 [Patellaria atrata CBS 101060]|uniref:DUF952 domain-containing protein n=1 Tax=Patellaria atrata CBS 101060 TaxID=1346257 RepID=A0A9P4SAC3_9PEZI|nr:hypothetical protein M501DRAFT_1017020 [Patellaria atrata CBS 101060]
MSSESLKHVYKIGTAFPSLEELNGGTYPLSPLDAADGFIHLSTSSQVPATCGRFFADHKEITLLKIPLEKVENKVKWEASRGHGVFAHIYGDLIASDVTDRKTFALKEGEEWEKVLKTEEWLEA